MKASKVLFEAWKLFHGGKNWMRYEATDGLGSYCAIGALNEFLTNSHPRTAHDYLRDAIEEKYHTNVISYFNDKLATSYNDVSRVFRRAAQLARAEGN